MEKSTSEDWSAAVDEDEGDPAAERAEAHRRMTKRESTVVHVAVQQTLLILGRIRINNVASLPKGRKGGNVNLFFRFKGSCMMGFAHQSSSGVMVTIAKNNTWLCAPPGILWAPGRDPWVITYLIAGYYRIDRAVYELHSQTGLFCKYGHMRRCSICNNLQFIRTPFQLMDVKLVPLWDEDDPERASDTSLNLAEVRTSLIQTKASVPRPRVRKLYVQ